MIVIITAVVRLQGRDSSGIASFFVARGAKAHGTDPVSQFEVRGGSWTAVRGHLRAALVTGAHRVKRDTVESWKSDIGKDYGRLRRLPAAAEVK